MQIQLLFIKFQPKSLKICSNFNSSTSTIHPTPYPPIGIATSAKEHKFHSTNRKSSLYLFIFPKVYLNQPNKQSTVQFSAKSPNPYACFPVLPKSIDVSPTNGTTSSSSCTQNMSKYLWIPSSALFSTF